MKGMVKEVIKKMDARDCLYPLYLVVIACQSSRAVIGEDVLCRLNGWLSPPDPSTNYNIGLRDLHKKTATWFLEGSIFQEWYLTGSLLWIHGKRAFLYGVVCFSLTTPTIYDSRFGEEHPLVRDFFGLSLYDG